MELFPSESVQLGWRDGGDWSVGAGMYNVGNTCYLNATLQALFHVPALANWLVSVEEQIVHAPNCPNSDDQCVICLVRETLEESQQESGGLICPFRVIDILSVLSKEFQLGRQQDAHEFLRCLVEHMTKAYLVRSKGRRIDQKEQETTPLNQIFGGNLVSTVECERCSFKSTTEQHFQDLLLDVKENNTVEEAVAEFFTAESLEGYGCEGCKQKVTATKQFAMERPPKVVCLQLKRFCYFSNQKVSKHVDFNRKLDLTQFSMSGEPLSYKLVSIISHQGASMSRGHYTAVAQAACGSFYKFDDTRVSELSDEEVSETSAYVMFYELEPHTPPEVLDEDRADVTDFELEMAAYPSGDYAPSPMSKRRKTR